MVENERVGKFCDGAKVCTVLVGYDDNGNQTRQAIRSDESGTSSTEWTYDKNPNPQNLLPNFKGWPAKCPLNNVVRMFSKNSGFTRSDGSVFLPTGSTDTFVYTYNAQGYPVQVKNTFASLREIDNRTYTHEYENCPVQ